MKQFKHFLVVIADGEHARFVVPGKIAGAFRTMASVTSPNAHQRTSDLVSDGLGRSYESGSPTHHAVAPHNDPHELAKLRFIRSIAERTNVMVTEGKADGVLLVAPAYALAELKDKLTTTAAARVVGVVQHDLVKVPDHDLSEHLKEWAQPAHLDA